MADTAEFEVSFDVVGEAQLRKAGSALDQLATKFEKFNSKALSKLKGATQAFATKAKDVLLIGGAIGGAIAGGVVALSLGMADFAQRSQTAFSLLAQGGETAEGLFQRSIDLATELGLDIKDTTAEIQRFRALGFTQLKAEELIKMGSDMRALGASTEQVTRIFAQLGQIQAKGKLQGEELIVLAENGLSVQEVYSQLEKQLGKTRAEVLKMQQAGEITAPDALKAIGQAVLKTAKTKDFGEAGRRMATETLSGMAGLLKAQVQGVFLKIGQAAGPAFFETFGAIFDEIEGFLMSDTGKAFVEGIGTALRDAAVAVKQALPFVKEFLGAFGAGASEAFKELSGAMKAFFEPFTGGDGKASVALLKEVGRALGQIVVFGGAVILMFGALLTASVAVATLMKNAIVGAFNAWTTTLGNLIFTVMDAIANIRAAFASGNWFDIGKQIVMGIARGIVAFAMAPINQAKLVAQSAVAAVKSTLGIASPSKVFEQIGSQMSSGMALGVANDTQPIMGATRDLARGATAGATVGMGARGGSTITFGAINVNVNGANKGGPELGREIAVSIQRELSHLLEGLAIEAA